MRIACVGIIGLGDMGRLYARSMAAAGLRVLGADLAEREPELRAELEPLGVSVVDAARVVGEAELVIYSLPARAIEGVVARLGPVTRPYSIVGGQTAAKGAEIEAFERHLPSSCPIVTCHSLHGPSLSPAGQTLLLLRHRASDAEYEKAREAFASLGSRIVEVASAEAHDRLMADIQAVTHVCFEAMGTAWTRAGILPWSSGAYAGGVDHVKTLMTARIFAGKAHVYGELAILNAFSSPQVRQYARSVRELLALIARGDESAYRDRVLSARDALLAGREASVPLLDPARLAELARSAGTPPREPNSQLSLIAMFDAWKRLGIQPFDHLMAETPPYRLRVGIAEHLFRDPALLEESIAATFASGVRRDDKLFSEAVDEWARAVESADFAAYERLFEEARAHFAPRLAQAVSESNVMIGKLLSKPGSTK